MPEQAGVPGQPPEWLFPSGRTLLPFLTAELWVSPLPSGGYRPHRTNEEVWMHRELHTGPLSVDRNEVNSCLLLIFFSQ